MRFDLVQDDLIFFFCFLKSVIYICCHILIYTLYNLYLHNETCSKKKGTLEHYLKVDRPGNPDSARIDRDDVFVRVSCHLCLAVMEVEH